MREMGQIGKLRGIYSKDIALTQTDWNNHI